uniref:Uncharacterized protein n=1 Tax=Cacopsylla melanoneura TaxID=428564 RepID=A0A8D9AKU9_9HEMI
MKARQKLPKAEDTDNLDTSDTEFPKRKKTTPFSPGSDSSESEMFDKGSMSADKMLKIGKPSLAPPLAPPGPKAQKPESRKDPPSSKNPPEFVRGTPRSRKIAFRQEDSHSSSQRIS